MNIKLNFERRVWKKIMKNNKGRGQWRPELNVNMDYLVCSFIKICLVKYIIPNCSINLVIYLFLLKCARQQQGTDWCGYYICGYLHIMTPCGKPTTEDMRVRPNRSLVHFHNYTNAHDVNISVLFS